MKKIKSSLTENMDICVITGSYDVERHHIFCGANRKKSEAYGYVVPIRKDFHPNGVHFRKSAEMEAYLNVLGYESIDIYLKSISQLHFEEYVGTRDEFMKIFGKNYL